MYYQLFKNVIGAVNSVVYVLPDAEKYIPFDPANMDFVAFKQAINDDTAQLEDADGNLMTAEEAKAYVATLP